MTREDILKHYDVRDGVIVSPGKFEGEPIYAPYFYDCMLNGMADEFGSTEDGTPDKFTVTDEDRALFPELTGGMADEFGSTEDGTPDKFTVTDEDRALFPELTGVKGIYLYEGDQGFVSLEHIE